MPCCVCHAFILHVSFKIWQNEHVQDARGLPSPGRKGVARLWPQNGRQVGEIVEIYENSFKNFIFELPGVARVSVALIQMREAQYFFSGLTVSIRWTLLWIVIPWWMSLLVQYFRPMSIVLQLLLQFPCHFEFNLTFLVKLAEHTYRWHSNRHLQIILIHNIIYSYIYNIEIIHRLTFSVQQSLWYIPHQQLVGTTANES